MKSIPLIFNIATKFMIGASFFIIFFIPQSEPEIKKSSSSRDKIISLSPSITKQIIDLEAEQKLIGVTSYHPPLQNKITVIGNIIRPNIEKIISLKPDLVLFSAEDQAVQFSEILTNLGINTYSFSKNQNFKDICTNYLQLAKLLGQTAIAQQKIEAYQKELKLINSPHRKKIAFFLSNQPLITISQNSFINNIIDDAGGDNILKFLDSPYPIISLENLVLLNPDIIISVIPESKKQFTNLLKDFTNMKAIHNKNIYTIPNDTICYYTPQDYLLAHKQIQNIIKKSSSIN